MENKRDIRIQLFVTEEMDDKLDFLAESMGLRKNELIRMAIANYLGQWNQGIELAKTFFREHPDMVMDEAKRRTEQARTGKP